MSKLPYLQDYYNEHALGTWTVYFEDEIYKVQCGDCHSILAVQYVNVEQTQPKVSNCTKHYNTKACSKTREAMKDAGGGASPTEDAVDAEDKRLGLGLGCYYFVNLCAKCLTPWPSGHFSYSIVKIAFEIVAPSNFYF